MSAEEDEGQEKSFEPTPRKLEQAREKGDVAVSADMHTAGAYLGLLAALVGFGAASALAFGDALSPFIGSSDQLVGRILGPGGLVLSAQLVGVAALAALPIFLLPMAGVIASLVAQNAVVFATDKVIPKIERIDPIKTAGNKFGPTGLFEFAKSAVKMTLIGVAAWWWMSAEAGRIIRLAAAAPAAVGSELGGTVLSLMTVILVITAAIAVIDWLWQRFDHARKLRMSIEEIKKESKESEGDPYTRAARRRRAEEIATNRMLEDVPKADVVIVNPTHYAVALSWKRAKGSAPRCVAKGVDEVAARIRARAAEAGVPIHLDPPTARALWASVEIGREVKQEHYRAVAAAIRFADQMRREARERRGR